MRRVVGAVLVATAGALVLGGCSAPSGEREGGTTARPALREPGRPQQLDRETRLAACLNGEDGAARRSTTVVVPLSWSETGGLTTDLGAADEETDDEASCTLGDLGNGRDDPRPGTDLFVISAPTTRDLAADAARLATGPDEPVVEPAQVLGQRGERTAYAAEDVDRVRYDVVSLQAGDVRVSRWTPTGRSADRTDAETAAADQVWATVQDSLAVRAPAAADGDADADSDEAPGEDDTGEVVAFEPAGAAVPVPGSTALLCADGGRQVTVSVPDRLGGSDPCLSARPGSDGSSEESLGVEPTVGEPLWDAYQEELRFEAEGGDDATSELEYDGDVPGPGGLRAASLVYTYANDGVPYETHVVQAGGVRLRWTVRPGAWGPQAEELETVLASMGASAG